MKEKILVVFTGGTIGSKIENNIIDVSIEKKYLLLDMYKKNNSESEIIFDTISPINILSENATVEDWIKITTSIREQELSEYKGIIITYGTDTIAYFANTISYMLYDLKIPITIVSSNSVLNEEKSNGLVNFEVAVDFILQNNSKGVFVAYKNDDEITYIHRGSRVKQISEISENLYSINNSYFAKVNNNYIICCEKEDSKKSLYKCKFVPKMDEILHIKHIVGQKYDFDIKNYRIIYHEMFHSGTIPAQAISLIKECKEKNILFFMGITKKEKEDLYNSTNKAIEEGAIILSNMSQEAAITKLMIANGTFENNEEIIEFMKNNIIGEIIEK